MHPDPVYLLEYVGIQIIIAEKFANAEQVSIRQQQCSWLVQKIVPISYYSRA